MSTPDLKVGDKIYRLIIWGLNNSDVRLKLNQFIITEIETPIDYPDFSYYHYNDEYNGNLSIEKRYLITKIRYTDTDNGNEYIIYSDSIEGIFERFKKLIKEQTENQIRYLNYLINLNPTDLLEQQMLKEL